MIFFRSIRRSTVLPIFLSIVLRPHREPPPINRRALSCALHSRVIGRPRKERSPVHHFGCIHRWLSVLVHWCGQAVNWARQTDRPTTRPTRRVSVDSRHWWSTVHVIINAKFRITVVGRRRKNGATWRRTGDGGCCYVCFDGGIYACHVIAINGALTENAYCGALGERQVAAPILTRWGWGLRAGLRTDRGLNSRSWNSRSI